MVGGRSGAGKGDSMVTLYRNENEGGKTRITLELLPDGSLQLFYYDIGEDARRSFGDSDYESWITSPAAELPRLALGHIPINGIPLGASF